MPYSAKYSRDKTFVVFVIYSLSANVFLLIVCRATQSYTGDVHNHEAFFRECYQGDVTAKVLSLEYILYYMVPLGMLLPKWNL